VASIGRRDEVRLMMALGLLSLGSLGCAAAVEPPAASRCAPLPEPIGPLSARVVLVDELVTGDFDGEVMVRNDGEVPVALTLGVQALVLLDQRSAEPVGAYSGFVELSAMLASVDPGDELAVRAFGGVASCDPTAGSVPPGDYLVTAVVQTSAGIAIAEPAPIRVA
jgi:hypothetical protein